MHAGVSYGVFKKEFINMEKKYVITEVDPQLIAFNKENVRDESPEVIEADENYQRLKESVAEFGVLVPLVVKPHKEGSKIYLLIDGERRLRSSLATNQKKVPVHILIDTNAENEILYAFQIHMLRKEWSLIAQARALVKIYKNVKTKSGKRREKELFELVQEKTGYSDPKLKDLFRVLKYVHENEKILDEIDDVKSNIKVSHLVQLEASFVEQIERLFPEIIKEYGTSAIRKKLVEKVRAEVIGSTREPIEKLLPLFIQARSKEQKDYLKKLIKEFLDKSDKTPEDIYRSFELKFPINKEDLVKLVEEAEKKMEELESIIENLGYAQFSIYSNLKANFKKRIERLIKVLNKAKSRTK
jgi:ParB/RepB/Spo0J family partition protein